MFWTNNSKFNFSDLRTRDGTMVRNIELRNYVVKHVSVKLNLIFTSLSSNSFHLGNGRTGTLFSQSIGAYLIRIEIIKRYCIANVRYTQRYNLKLTISNYSTQLIRDILCNNNKYWTRSFEFYQNKKDYKKTFN